MKLITTSLNDGKFTSEKILFLGKWCVPYGSKNLKLLWSNVVQIPQSLYRESPGMDPFRPNQKTSIENFYLAGSYTKQDYIDSMEGATMSGHLAASVMLNKEVKLAKNLAVS